MLFAQFLLLMIPKQTIKAQFNYQIKRIVHGLRKKKYVYLKNFKVNVNISKLKFL